MARGKQAQALAIKLSRESDARKRKCRRQRNDTRSRPARERSRIWKSVASGRGDGRGSVLGEHEADFSRIGPAWANRLELTAGSTGTSPNLPSILAEQGQTRSARKESFIDGGHSALARHGQVVQLIRDFLDHLEWR